MMAVEGAREEQGARGARSRSSQTVIQKAARRMSHGRVEGGRSHAGDLAVDTREMMDRDGAERHEDLGAGEEQSRLGDMMFLKAETKPE